MADDWLALEPDAAIAYLRGLQPVSDAVFEQLEREAASRAFTVAGVYRMDTLQRILDELEGAARGNVSLEDFVAKLESEDLSASHLETVYTTNLQSAFGRGLWEQGTQTEIAGEIWGWRYFCVHDDQTRPEHEALDEKVFRTGEHDEVFPPWDFKCRCGAEWITNAEAEELGLKTDELPSDVRDSLGATDFASPALGEDYRPDFGGYDLGLVGEFLQEGIR